MSETVTTSAHGPVHGPVHEPAHAPGFDKHPNYRVEFLACPKRIRATFNGETIVDGAAVTPKSNGLELDSGFGARGLPRQTAILSL